MSHDEFSMDPDTHYRDERAGMQARIDALAGENAELRVELAFARTRRRRRRRFWQAAFHPVPVGVALLTIALVYGLVILGMEDQRRARQAELDACKADAADLWRQLADRPRAGAPGFPAPGDPLAPRGE